VLGFVRISSVSDLPQGRGRTFRVGGRSVAVLREGDRIVAVDDACPHMGASLADGTLESGVLTCPWHGWRYDAATGQGQAPARPWACVRVYEVKIEGDDVFVRCPDVEVLPPEPEDDPSYWDAERWFRKPE